MRLRSGFVRLHAFVLLIPTLCLLGTIAQADVILHSAGWAVGSAGDSYTKERIWDDEEEPYVYLVDAPAWNESAHSDTALGGIAHQAAGSSDSDLAQAQGAAVAQSWLGGTRFRATGSITGDAFGDSGSTGGYDVNAWAELDLFSSFEAVFELTAPQLVNIAGNIRSTTEDAYTYADTYIRLSSLDGATLLDTYANPFAALNLISFSQLLAPNSYRLELMTSFDYRTAREYMVCEGGYDITADFGSPILTGVVPEPASLTLLCFGVMGLIANRLRRR